MNALQQTSEEEGLVDVVEKAALLQEQIVLQPFLQLLSEAGFLWV